MNRTGKRQTSQLIMNGVELESHEYATVLFLVGLGKNIELIPQSHTPSVKSPDLYMDGLVWEVKSPVNSTRRAIERLFYRATGQSSNLVFDLRRIKKNDTSVSIILEKCFKNTRRVRNMYIITKDGNINRYRKR